MQEQQGRGVKGDFSPLKLQGKRGIELGAGCGLAGLGERLVTCDL